MKGRIEILSSELSNFYKDKIKLLLSAKVSKLGELWPVLEREIFRADASDLEANMFEEICDSADDQPLSNNRGSQSPTGNGQNRVRLRLCSRYLRSQFCSFFSFRG